MLCKPLMLFVALAVFMTSCSSVDTQQPLADRCRTPHSKIELQNTAITSVSYHKKGSVISLPDTDPSCGIAAVNITADLCRIVFDTATTNSSSVHFEAWLPVDWNVSNWLLHDYA